MYVSNPTLIIKIANRMRDLIGANILTQIHDRLFVVNRTVPEAKALLHDRQKAIHFVCLDGKFECLELGSPRIDQISQFVRFIHRTLQADSSKSVVMCVGRASPGSLTIAALLLGGFMILGKGMSSDEVVSHFGGLDDDFVSFRDESDDAQYSVRDCWLALHLAREKGWIHLSNDITAQMDCLDFGSLDIDAYAHYSKIANGSFFPVVPDKIVFFPSPASLPDNREWMDTDDGKRRLFSAGYCADLLRSEFNVSVVACVDSGTSDWPEFAEHGIDAEELPLDGSSPSLLRAMDRLIAFADSSSGAVALHSESEAVGWRAGALVAAYLVRRLDFPPEAATAWIRMVHPALLVGRPGGGSWGVADEVWTGSASLSRSVSASVGGEPRVGASAGAGGMPGAIRRAASSAMDDSGGWRGSGEAAGGS